MSTRSFQASSQRNGYTSDVSDSQTRCSSRVTTPVRNSGMIWPSQDSRRSLCQNDAQSRPTSPPPKQTKKRNPGPAESESESKEESKDELADTDDSEPVVVSKANKKTRGSQSKSTTSKRTRGSKSQSQSTVANSQNASGTVNLTQDSDAENSKVRKKRQRKNPEFDALKAYFSEAFHRDGDPKDRNPITYNCLWCEKEVRVSQSSLSNLRTHCDGSRQQGRMSHGCPKCQEAILAGAKLPQTSLQDNQLQKNTKNPMLTRFFAQTEKFDNVTFNQMITLWLLHQALPWNRVEDPYLQATFAYCEAGSHLFKRQWAADSARIVYLDLQEAMINLVKVSKYLL
ncbi:hypothetical protein PCASD_24900 [Puccinia coronata f. sp. avenae]|uniref:Uncharacterized protein n=1 Tax=Puccinia coronata f. sp. avenae TaxID=200324 RepID=A0A2N5S6K3_9BASI|nr:hypothetical protein PCASD_24900 [Puccinia coronata f. sp. avenae]